MESEKWYRVRNLAQLGQEPGGPQYNNDADGGLGPRYTSLEDAKKRALALNKSTGDQGQVIVEDERGREVFRPDAADEAEALAR
jgi:hypothetical protein